MAIAAGATGTTGQTQNSTTASSGSFTVHVGDCIIVAVSNPTLTSYQVTDNLGNVYSLAGLSGAVHQLWICLPVTVAGSCIVTATTATAPTTLFVTPQVYTGVGSLGQIGTAVSNTTIPWASPAITTVIGNWLVGQFYQAIAGSVNTAVSPTILRATSYTGGVTGVITLADIAATADGALQVTIQPNQSVAMYRHAIELVPSTVGAPVLTSISPTSDNQGTTASVTLTGTGFTGATGINVSGTGITVTNFTVVSDTSITATFTITATATTGARTVSVASPNGTSNTVNFTVLMHLPTFASLTPTTGDQGTSVPIIIGGQYFTGATGLNIVGGTGVTYTNFVVVSDTEITATLVIASNASPSRNLQVQGAGGASSGRIFSVTTPTFTLTASPDSLTVEQGQTTSSTITINGSAGFTSPVTLSETGAPSGVTITFTPNPATSTSLMSVVASNSAATGTVIITVSGTGGGVTATVDITLEVLPHAVGVPRIRSNARILWRFRTRTY